MPLFFVKSKKLKVKSVPQQGQAITIAALFFLIISLTVSLGAVNPVLNQVDSVRSLEKGARSLYGASGVSEDVLYRLSKGLTVGDVETISYGGYSATATTTTVFDGKEVMAAGNQDSFVRKNKAHLTTGSGASFNYGMQSGEGGIVFENSSSVLGNAYSNGPITGADFNLIRGDVVSAGPAGRIEGVHATSSAYAHTITDSTIDKDAYYQSISGTGVSGALHPNSPDQATTTLPISDAQISEWEAAAEAGGVINSPCPYKIDDDTTIGPKKINCDLEISKNGTVVTLTGPLWVAGNIDVVNASTIKIAPSLGSNSVAVIADKPSNRTTSSKIILQNESTYQGSGDPKSYILFISQNSSAETGGSEIAINLKNFASGKLLIYAPHGEILLENHANLKEVTGWKLHLKNDAKVIYETGLANLLFTSGPAGGYMFDRWREVE